MIDFDNKTVFKLKPNADYAARVTELLIEGETVLAAFSSFRDGVVFTNRRLIALNVKGLTGSKRDFTSLPYRNVVAYSVETAGTFDVDSELTLYFSSLGAVRFEFTGQTPITEISRTIAEFIL